MDQKNESMKNRICLVTGATDGIGRATASALAGLGATVVVLGRNLKKIDDTIARLKRETGNEAVAGLLCDLSSQASIRAAAEEFRSRFPALHVLVNNAGGYFSRRTLTVDGLETTFALDHLAYFLLTNLLLDLIVRSAPARIVNVSSRMHQSGRIEFDNLQGERSYGGMDAYARAKLANVLFTFELARRLEDTGVTVNCLHPGFVRTSFMSSGGGLFGRLGGAVASLGGITPEEGAKTSVYLACSSEVEGKTGGYYYLNRLVPHNPEADDRGKAARLWNVSAELTGLEAAKDRPSAAGE
jgi:NAD(P)-dependent dehydrogenase (short-subunit alcohol dehydrogenase family)